MKKAILLTLFLLCFVSADIPIPLLGFFEEFHSIYENEQMARNRRDGSTAPSSSPSLQTQYVNYKDGDTNLKGYVAYNTATGTPQEKKPVVLVVHDWNGRDAFENGKAEALARLGYVGFALDLYGKVGTTPEENALLMKPLRENRPLLLKRLKLAINEAKKLNIVNGDKMGAIGFCFGGMGVLDMARANLDLKGVVSFHGSLNPLPDKKNDTSPVRAKMLVLHGHDDPGIPPAMVQAFEEEMTLRKADWQVHVFSNTVHAFTVPDANTTGRAMYSPLADKRSWLAMKNFFEEVFA